MDQSNQSEHSNEFSANSSNSTSLVKDTTYTFASRVLSIVLSMGIASAVARFLGPGGRGELAICIIFAQLLVLGLGFGVEMGCAFHAGREPSKIGAVLGTQFVSFIITSIMIVVAGWLCLTSSMSFVDKVSDQSLWYAVFFAVAQLMFVYLTVLFMGIGELTAYNLARIGNQGVILLFILITCWTAPSVSSAVLGYFFGSLLGGLFLLILLLRKRMLQRFSVSWDMIRSCYKYGIKYYFGKLATLADVQMGVIIITLMGNSTAQVGLFAVAMGLVTKLWILPESLNIVLLSRVLKGQSAVSETVTRSCRMALIVAVCGGIVIAIFSKQIVLILFTSTFLPSVTPMLILLPGIIAACIFKVLFSYFNGVGKPEYTSLTLVVGLSINIVLVMMWLPRWGLSGAAAAASVAYIIEAGLAMLLFIKQTKCSPMAFIPQMGDLQTILSRMKRQPLAVDATSSNGDSSA